MVTGAGGSPAAPPAIVEGAGPAPPPARPQRPAVGPVLLSVVAGGLLLYLAAWGAPVLGPLGMGLFLAALAAPLFSWLGAHGRSPLVSLVVTIAIILAVGCAIVVLAIVSARSLSDSLATYAADLDRRYGEIPAGGLRDLIPPDALMSVLRSVITILGQVATAFGFATVVAALLLLDGPRLAGLAREDAATRGGPVRLVGEGARGALAYFAVRIRVNLVTAAALLALMLVLGVDDALLWAVATFFLSFVPYLGLVLALIPPTILALAESGPLAALAIVIGGTILNLVAENILEPTLTGRALELSTWLVFVAFFVWVWVFGPIGALLSMPITVLIVLVLRESERTRWLAALASREVADPAGP